MERVKKLFKNLRDYVTPLLILILGAALSVVLFIYLNHVEKQRLREAFEDSAIEPVEAVREGIRMNIGQLEAVSAFFAASRKVERREFHEFAKTLFKDNRGMQALEWIPRVAGHERRKYVQAARRDGVAGFTITEKGLDGKMVPAGVRSEYYPVYFLEPYKGNERALGFDLASEDIRRQAMERARDSGTAAATGPIRLVQEQGDEPGMLVFVPFYRNGTATDTVEARRKNLQGFVLGVFRIGDMVGKALSPWKKEHNIVYMHIYDVTSPVPDTLIYDSFPPQLKIKRKEIEAGICYKASIDVDGRKWLVLGAPSAWFLAQEKDFYPLGFFIAGLALTMMASFHIFNVVRRSREIERHVWELGISREALGESEKRFRRLAENAQDIIFRYEFLPKNCFAYLSPAVTTITGYTPEELYADPGLGLRIVHPDDRNLMREYFKKESSSQQPLTFRWVRKDGTMIWIEQHNVPIFSDAGNLIAVEGIARDITERTLAQQALEKAAVEWTAAMDAYDDAIYLLDLDRRLMRANKAFYYMIGAGPQTFIGRHITELIHPGGEAIPCPVCRAQEEKRDETIIMEAGDPVNPAGKPVQITVKMIRGRDGQAQSILMSLHNLSHERQLQEEKQKLEAQLRHVQKMEAIGQLAGGVAHDFNNILNVIIGYGSMVLNKIGPDSSAREQMHEVLAAAERAATLTKRLLIFSRKQVVDVNPVNVNEIISGVQKMLTRIIGEDIDLQVDLAGKRLMVMADNGQIEQVLMNLATNARDAMPKGGHLTIHSETTQMDNEYVATYGYGKPGPYAMIVVADTGCGIDPKTQEKIFEPFFTTKGIGEGTGLGLAISYGIIKQHKGYINCNSEPGKGTAFKIYLPLIEDLAASRIMAEAPVSIKGGTETILVAEDDPSLRKLTRIILESFGYRVITAKDGEEAVAKYREHKDRIQLVILDLVMPKKSGTEAYKEIRTMSPGMRSFFLSGYTKDMIGRMDIEVGMKVVHKPYVPKDLLKKVREILDA